ncbi:SPFH/Band 7/PHB domain protein [Trichinella nativa]|uniref:SPFH/Band 7/PHB domain protein n=1 Tax=Trichinella nativa TaxID=6335 RepID=A0A1Y3E429_9BILA|nr:SPFH/Band 7/PHB domain protein [Trichinella nativa]
MAAKQSVDPAYNFQQYRPDYLARLRRSIHVKIILHMKFKSVTFSISLHRGIFVIEQFATDINRFSLYSSFIDGYLFVPKHAWELSLQRSQVNSIVTSIREGDKDDDFGPCHWLLIVFSWFILALTLPFSLFFCLTVVKEYERAVIFRLGRLLPGGARGPGIFFINPCTDTYRKVDLRVVSFDVPPQEILSKDSVTVAVDAVVYSRISNATISVINVEDAMLSTKLLAQTTLRNILGTKTLTEILCDREVISQTMQTSLDEATDPWGVKVERVEVKDVRLPVQLQRAMAAEAEATREARAKAIAADGEQQASKALKEAADIISQSPAALQLRYLQTLTTISAERNSTVIFPFPVDILSYLSRAHRNSSTTTESTKTAQSSAVAVVPTSIAGCSASTSLSPSTSFFSAGSSFTTVGPPPLHPQTPTTPTPTQPTGNML